MRKNLFFIIILGMATLQSCSKFLEVKQLGKSDIANYLSDIDGIRTAATGIYSTAYKFYDQYFIRYADVSGDMVSMPVTSTEYSLSNLYNFTSEPTDNTGYPRYIWRSGLTVLTNANNVLEYLPAAKEKYPQNRDELRKYEAEALYFRALSLLDLCLCYGQHYTYTPDGSHLGVPILLATPNINETILRDNVKDVYGRVVEDLNNALAIYNEIDPTTADYYYVSANACKALLARVYLYMENWDMAESLATELINTIPLTSREDYVNMFQGGSMATNLKNTEAIFRLSGYDAGISLYSFYSRENGNADMLPAKALYELFDDPDDIRLELLYEEVNGDRLEACAKYSVSHEILTNNRNYAPFVSRVSEMYLIRAEALCNRSNPDLDGAADDLKALIARATGKGKDQIVLTYANQDEVNALIEKERIKELCFEGHRFFDITRRRQNLIRKDDAGAISLQVDYPSNRFVLPICQLELEANQGIQQNPGYQAEF